MVLHTHMVLNRIHMYDWEGLITIAHNEFLSSEEIPRNRGRLQV